ncbi:MAG: ArgE/DapE family deacylase [Actinobacteria bacterium]|nr:ArgE/DapE family deacylase [Actinomycetota bacterium]
MPDPNGRGQLDVNGLLSELSEQRVVELASSLIEIPSINPPGEYEEVTTLVEGIFRRMGLEVSTTDCHEGRTNIVGFLKGSGGGDSVCLASHMDVVPTGDPAAWDRDPFRPVVEDGILWGRGSADSKGMLAGMIAAVEAIQASHVQLSGDLYLVAYVDDETAGPCGLRDVFKHGLARADHVILGEATDHIVQHVFKGRIWVVIETEGLASHGAFPDRGVNAIDKAVEIMKAVRSIPLEEHPLLGPDTVSIGKIEGGHQVNVVADRCSVWFDVRWGPPRTSKEILGSIAEAAAAVDPSFDQVRSMVVTEERDPLVFDPEEGLFSVMREAGKEVLGRSLEMGGWYSSGELWPLHSQGSMKVGAVVGPGQPWQAHAFNEHIRVDELVKGAQVYAVTAASLAL